MPGSNSRSCPAARGVLRSLRTRDTRPVRQDHRGSPPAGSMLLRGGSIPGKGIAGGNTPGTRQCHRDGGAAPPAMGVPHLRQLAQPSSASGPGNHARTVTGCEPALLARTVRVRAGRVKLKFRQAPRHATSAAGSAVRITRWSGTWRSRMAVMIATGLPHGLNFWCWKRRRRAAA